MFILFITYTQVKDNQNKQSQTYVIQLSGQIQETIQRFVSIVETAALDPRIISLDYTQAEPYMTDLINIEGSDYWSHFIVANQYGTEQAHSEGEQYHGVSIRTEEAFKKAWDSKTTVNEAYSFIFLLASILIPSLIIAVLISIASSFYLSKNKSY